MFKKQLIVVAVFGILCTALIGYSIVSVQSNQKSFSGSGYVHTTKNESKKIVFENGTNYKNKVDGIVNFKDAVGESNNVDVKNYIHYDNSSLSSFSDGVLVDLDEISDNPSMNHYALSSNITLENNNSSYSAMDSSQEVSFKNFLWKIDENKYMFVSPTMNLLVGDEDQRKISGYTEVTYIGERLIQIQTNENVWTTISEDCHLLVDNGLKINLSDRYIEDSEGNALLDFSRIVLDSEGNIELSPLDAAKGETVIPHFDITAEDGQDGVGGNAGTNGEAGVSAMDGEPGTFGGDGDEGLEGQSEELTGDVLNFPVFTVLDWNVSGSSCSGKIRVTEDKDDTADSMLIRDLDDSSMWAQLYLVDLDTGRTIYLQTPAKDQYQYWNIAGKSSDTSFQTIDFTFEGLEPEHSYMLHAAAPTQINADSAPYLRPYISKTFWTDSAGIFGEPISSTLDSVTFKVTRQPYSGDYTVYYTLYSDYASAALLIDPASGVAWESCGFASGETNVQIETKKDNNGADLVRNHKYYVRLCYDPTGTGTSNNFYLVSQILELTTLKQTATLSYPTLTVNSNAWGFDVSPGMIIDEDKGIISLTYEFYDDEQFDSNGNLKPNAVCAKSITTESTETMTVSLDGTQLKPRTNYRARIIAKFNDNEKDFYIPTGFSNAVQVEGSMKPKVYFKGQYQVTTGGSWYDITGTQVKVPEYDAIIGEIRVAPGANGSSLKLVHNEGDPYTIPTLTIRLSGYYEATYPVLPVDFVYAASSSAYTNLEYLVGKEENGEVVIKIPDGITAPTSGSIQGLQPGKMYEIIVNGDLESGPSEIERDVEVGRCVIETSPTVSMMARWTTNKGAGTDALQNATLKIVKDEASAGDKQYEFNRQRSALSTATIKLFYTDVAEDLLDSTNPNATIVLDKSTTDGAEKIAKLFSDDGLKLESADFNRASSDLIQNPYMTLFVDTVYDYTTFEANRTHQSLYSTINEYDKEKNTSTNRYFYRNKFNVRNYFKNSSNEERGACYITSVRGINPLSTHNNFLKLEAYNDGVADTYVAQSAYSNGESSANAVVYYVYDAVDFYAGNQIVADPANPTNPYDPSVTSPTQYKYQYNGQTYTLNPDLYNYVKGGVYQTDNPSSVALDFATPVHLNGLELAKIRIVVPARKSPSPIRFVPMTKAEYANRKGVPVSSIPSVDPTTGQYFLFFPDGSSIPENGHQYVIAWTVEGHTEEPNEHYIYPFDASVYTGGTVNKTYKDYATYDYDKLIKDDEYVGITTNTTSKYYLDNADATFGNQAYMLIPHSTFTECKDLDRPKIDALTYSLPYTSDANTMTNRVYVADKDKMVHLGTDGKVTVSRYVGAGGSNNYAATTTKVPVITNSPATSEYYIAQNMLDDSKLGTEIGEVTMNKKANIGETDGNKDIVTVIPVQRYIDKYTKNKAPLHSSTTNDYLDGNYYLDSGDHNYNMRNCLKSSRGGYITMNRYIELYTAKYSDFFDYTSSANQNLINQFNVDVKWKQEETGNIDTGYVIMTGPTSILQNALGVRMTFTGYDKSIGTSAEVSFTVDKYLRDGSTGDTYEKEYTASWDAGADAKTLVTSGSNTTLRFKFSVPGEMVKTVSEQRVDEGGTLQSFRTYDFSNEHEVKVNMSFLFETQKSGFASLVQTMSTKMNKHSYETYALKVFQRLNSTGGSTPYAEDYLKKSQNFRYFDFPAPTAINYADNGKTDFPKLGSMFNLALGQASGGAKMNIQTRSTRYWQFAGASYFDNSKTINTRTELIQEVFVPVQVGESVQIPTDRIHCYKTNNSEIAYPDNTNWLDMPASPPVISYGSIVKTHQSLLFNYEIGASEPTMFFTLSANVPAGDNNSVAKYYPIEFVSTSGGVTHVRIKNDSEGKPMEAADPAFNMYNLSSGKNGGGTTGSSYDDQNDANDYVISVNGGSKQIQFDNLKSNTSYTLVCWRWTFEDGKYRLTRIDMTDSNGNKARNYCTPKTDTLPQAKILDPNGAQDVYYTFYAVDDKYLGYQIQCAQFQVGTHYYTINLEDEDHNFLTYLEYGTSKTPTTIDMDGVTMSNPTTSTTIFAYQLGRGDITSYVDLRTDGKPKFNFEYGKKYYLSLHVYEHGHGPEICNGDASLYDHDHDPDSIFVNSAYGEDTTPYSPLITINNGMDTSSMTSSVTIRDGAPSYMTFNAGGLNAVRSGSLKGSKNRTSADITPVAVVEHFVKGGDGSVVATEYYDVTRFLKKDGTPVLNSGNVFQSSAIFTIDISYPDPDRPGKYKELFDIGDKVYVFIYSYQNGALQMLSNTNGIVSGSLLAENVAGATSDVAYVPTDMAHTLADRKAPGQVYQVPTNTSLGVYDSSCKITADQYNRLSSLQVENTAGAKSVSRKMTDSYKTMSSVQVSAGNVVAVVEGNTLYLTMTDVVAPTAIKTVTYQISADTQFEYEESDPDTGATVTKTDTRTITDDRIYAKDLGITSISDKYIRSIDLSAFNNKLDKLNEKITNYYFVIQFTSSEIGAHGSTDERYVIFSSACEDTAGQTLTKENTQLEISYNMGTDAGVTTLSFNPFKSLLNSMFKQNKEVAGNE